MKDINRIAERLVEEMPFIDNEGRMGDAIKEAIIPILREELGEPTNKDHNPEICFVCGDNIKDKIKSMLNKEQGEPTNQHPVDGSMVERANKHIDRLGDEIKPLGKLFKKHTIIKEALSYGYAQFAQQEIDEKWKLWTKATERADDWKETLDEATIKGKVQQIIDERMPSEDEIFSLAELLADECFPNDSGVSLYSERQELTIKFNEIITKKLQP